MLHFHATKNEGGSQMFYGVDLHSDSITIAAMGEEGETSRVFRYHLGTEAFEKFVERLTDNDYMIVEASTNTFWFYEKVRYRVGRCIIIDPRKIQGNDGVKVKTDKRDALQLVRLLRYVILTGATLPEVYIPEKPVQEIRQLFTTYYLYKRQMVMTKNRIHSLLKQEGYTVPKKSLDLAKTWDIIARFKLSVSAKIQIQQLYEQIESIRKGKELIKQEILVRGVIFQEEIELLTSIKGISVFMAIGIMADIVDINRFPSAKKLCAYLRTAPTVSSSNKMTRIGSINKNSRKLTISLLIESVEHFRSVEKINRFYAGKKKGKGAGKARVAVVRKIIVAIYYILKKRQYYYYRSEEMHCRKLNEYENFLKKVA